MESRIGDAGAAALGEALKATEAPLARLNLTNNGIGDAGRDAQRLPSKSAG